MPRVNTVYCREAAAAPVRYPYCPKFRACGLMDERAPSLQVPREGRSRNLFL